MAIKKLKFLILLAINAVLILADGVLTYINTPDLSMEGNPLVAKLGLGWGALAIANIIGFAVILITGYYCFCKYETIYCDQTKFTRYASQIVYHRPDKFYAIGIPKDIRPFIAMMGYMHMCTMPIGRAILVAEWTLITLIRQTHAKWIVSICREYFHIRNQYFHGKLHLIVATAASVILAFVWLYKEYRANLKKVQNVE